jgi:hypothetical protein
MNLGVNSRDALAETAQVSKRVIADLESGARDNFSERVLSKIEETLGWTSGTIDLIVTDPNFHPPEPQDSDDLMFVPAHYDRRPVAVESTAVTRLIAALKALGESNGDQLTPETRQLAEAAIGVCWPYIIRLVEDNCIPGVQLNPAVRPSYSAFTAVARYLAPADPSASYTQWLAGDLTGASESIAQRYRTRWVESTRVRRGRAPAPPQGAPQDS